MQSWILNLFDFYLDTNTEFYLLENCAETEVNYCCLILWEIIQNLFICFFIEQFYHHLQQTRLILFWLIWYFAIILVLHNEEYLPIYFYRYFHFISLSIRKIIKGTFCVVNRWNIETVFWTPPQNCAHLQIRFGGKSFSSHHLMLSNDSVDQDKCVLMKTNEKTHPASFRLLHKIFTGISLKCEAKCRMKLNIRDQNFIRSSRAF